MAGGKAGGAGAWGKSGEERREGGTRLPSILPASRALTPRPLHSSLRSPRALTAHPKRICVRSRKKKRNMGLDAGLTKKGGRGRKRGEGGKRRVAKDKEKEREREKVKK